MSSTEDRKKLSIITKLCKHPIPLIFSLKCNRQIKSRLSLERNGVIPLGIGQVSLCPGAVPELVCGYQGKEQWFLRAWGCLSTYFWIFTLGIFVLINRNECQLWIHCLYACWYFSWLEMQQECVTSFKAGNEVERLFCFRHNKVFGQVCQVRF